MRAGGQPQARQPRMPFGGRLGDWHLRVDGEELTPLEIKSGKTMSASYFDNLKYWRELAGLPADQGYVVYGGEQSMQTSAGAIVSWRHIDRIPG